MSANIRVLVVEDDDSIREALSDFLSEEGYTWYAAKDGMHAIDVLRSNAFDPTLIILDLNMPRLSGKEFLIERERIGLAPKARVVMLSATPALSKFPDVDAWVHKPVELDSLLEAIETYGA